MPCDAHSSHRLLTVVTSVIVWCALELFKVNVLAWYEVRWRQLSLTQLTTWDGWFRLAYALVWDHNSSPISVSHHPPNPWTLVIVAIRYIQCTLIVSNLWPILAAGWRSFSQLFNAKRACTVHAPPPPQPPSPSSSPVRKRRRFRRRARMHNSIQCLYHSGATSSACY